MFIPPSCTKSNLQLKCIEFFVFFIIGIIALIIALKHAITISSSNDPSIISGLTSSPYFSSAFIDLQDGQLKTFITEFSNLVFICITFLILRRGLFVYHGSAQYNIYFYALFGLALCIYLHGDGVIFTVNSHIWKLFFVQKFCWSKNFSYFFMDWEFRIFNHFKAL